MRSTVVVKLAMCHLVSILADVTSSPRYDEGESSPATNPKATINPKGNEHSDPHPFTIPPPGVLDAKIVEKIDPESFVAQMR